MQTVDKSLAMREVARRIERASLADCPVVIWGEEGSGKRFAAKTIHRQSRRGSGPLVIVRSETVAAGADSSQRMDEELFGTAQQPGKLAWAAGGTLLIDEITALSPTAQARLLEAAEGRVLFTSQDASKHRPDFRLMATTRFKLTESVQRGVLREDLHYRIGVVAIHVPPLRERPDDMPHLIGELLTEICAERGTPVPAVDADLVQFALDYPWPGNVAQLRDCLETMVRAGDASSLGVHHMQAALAECAGGFAAASSTQQVATLSRLERAAVQHALDVHHGNRTRAARSLGISVRTLQRKLRRWAT